MAGYCGPCSTLVSALAGERIESITAVSGGWRLDVRALLGADLRKIAPDRR